MDGRGRFADHIFIERLWRSLKRACGYLPGFSGEGDAHRDAASAPAYRERLSASGPSLRPDLHSTAEAA